MASEKDSQLASEVKPDATVVPALVPTGNAMPLTNTPDAHATTTVDQLLDGLMEEHEREALYNILAAC